MTPEAAQLMTEFVDIADRHGPLTPSCLRKTVVLAWLLSGHGMASAIRFGVTKEAHALQAHAWLETFPPMTARFFSDAEFHDLPPMDVATSHAGR